MRVSIIIATRNEADCIEAVIREISQVMSLLSVRYEVVIADYSTDDTVEKAEKIAKETGMRLRVVKVDRLGRGLAMREGVKHAEGNILILADADGSHDFHMIPQFLNEIHNAEMVMASRFPPIGWSEEHTFLHYYGNMLATWIINKMFGGKLTDTQNGFGAMTKEVWEKLGLDSKGWTFETQMFCRALKLGISIKEIPSIERKRIGGTAKLGVIDVAWRMALMVLREKSMS